LEDIIANQHATHEGPNESDDEIPDQTTPAQQDTDNPAGYQPIQCYNDKWGERSNLFERCHRTILMFDPAKRQCIQ
jgi:hypothetical protein